MNEAVRKTVMFIGVKNSAGQFAPYGSAFIGQWNEDGVNLSYLITAKHVVEQMTRTDLQFTGRLNHKNGQAIVGVLQKEEWQFHPSISKCDLAIAAFIASYETYDIKGNCSPG